MADRRGFGPRSVRPPCLAAAVRRSVRPPIAVITPYCGTEPVRLAWSVVPLARFGRLTPSAGGGTARLALVYGHGPTCHRPLPRAAVSASQVDIRRAHRPGQKTPAPRVDAWAKKSQCQGTKASACDGCIAKPAVLASRPSGRCTGDASPLKAMGLGAGALQQRSPEDPNAISTAPALQR